MLAQLQRSSSWTGRAAVLAVALLGSQLHGSGAPERAVADPGIALIVGSVMGLSMVVIGVARLLGRNIGLIGSDRQAIASLVVMMIVKIAIARIFLP